MLKEFFWKGQGDVWIEQSISKEIPLWQGYKKLMISGDPSKLARVLSMGQIIVRVSAEGILLEGQGDVWIEQSIVKEISLWQGYKKLMIASGLSKLARVLLMGQKIVCASAEEILLQDNYRLKENYKEKVKKKLMY